MSDPFRSARLKIDRAKHHIHELAALVIRFKAEHPHEVAVETDSEPGYKIHKFRFAKPVPYGSFSVVIGDAITNLRAALDHAIYACAIANGAAAESFAACNFPFSSDAAHFDSKVNGCKTVPEDIRTRLRTFRAYKGGHEALWALNNMCNRDKHALVTPILIGFESIRVENISGGRIESPKTLFGIA
jgi:hypothetical protein